MMLCFVYITSISNIFLFYCLNIILSEQIIITCFISYFKGNVFIIEENKFIYYIRLKLTQH